MLFLKTNSWFHLHSYRCCSSVSSEMSNFCYFLPLNHAHKFLAQLDISKTTLHNFSSYRSFIRWTYFVHIWRCIAQSLMALYNYLALGWLWESLMSKAWANLQILGSNTFLVSCVNLGPEFSQNLEVDKYFWLDNSRDKS